METSELLLLGAVGIGALLVYRSSTGGVAPYVTGAPLPPPQPPTAPPPITPATGNPLYSSGIPGAANPFAFAGQTKLEAGVAAGSGVFATAIASRVPVFGAAAKLTAGQDTVVNVTQTERAVHGITQIATGSPIQGAKTITSAVVTTAVQPIKSAAGVAKSAVTSVLHYL